MIKLFILSNFILISHFGRSMDDTIFFNTIDYVFFNNLYYTPDTSSFLRDGVYVKFESYTSLTIGKIENGERVGACEGYPSFANHKTWRYSSPF
jgi:hypothetical protein